MAKGENPAKRSERYARELKKGKNELTGKPLTKGQKRFRNGVLNERKWSADIFKKKSKRKRAVVKKRVTATSTKSTVPKRGAYNAFGKISENLIDGRNGAVVFWDGGDVPF